MNTDPIPAEPVATPASSHKSAPIPRLELITRGERRRRWTVEQKQTIAAQSLAPGASPTEVALQHDISIGQLYTWRHALMAAQPAAVAQAVGHFAQVDVVPQMVLQPSPGTAIPASAPAITAAATARPLGLIEIALPDGTTVRVDAQIDPCALRRIVAALRG
jgi:transposase